MRRITKYDRIALDPIHVAAALAGRWTLGRGRASGDVADLLCLDTGIRIGFRAWDRRAWGYHLIPGEIPRPLWGMFVWKHDQGFAVGTPAVEVATYIDDTLIPRYHQALADAETAKRERDDALARSRAARDHLAEQLEHGFPAQSDHDRLRPKRVRIDYVVLKDFMRIQLTLPVEEAIARAPALARALGASVDDTAASSHPDDAG
ncbi:hypothetical protein [Amycolatopsis sp. CA-230715]|uniref:hypothetical protein n=1 Tax=Amycolatopsis sp. CA-230715 TaxID=2745196 RepID=UPI001C01FE31|nr:hypothetical protein [Amycolatopsis sp. CA-230715]